MDQALVRVGPLELGEELDRGLGGDPDVLDDLAVAALQAERAGEVHPLAALAPRDRRRSPRRTQPWAGRLWCSGCTASAK